MVNYLHFVTIVARGDSSSIFSGAAMRSISALLACVSLLSGTAAWADSRVFIIANQPDGYGVDQCLARSEKCGAHAAQSYCQSRVSRWPRPIAGLTRTKSPARFRRNTKIAAVQV